MQHIGGLRYFYKTKYTLNSLLSLKPNSTYVACSKQIKTY